MKTRRTDNLVLCLVLPIFTLAMSALQADVLITEVVSGVSTSATSGDMVELFNRGPGSVDLTGWILTDLDPGSVESDPSSEGTFAPLSLSLPPLAAGQYAVITLVDSATATGSSFRVANYGLQITAPVTAGSFMAEDVDQLLLLNASGDPEDFLAWGNAAAALTGSNLTDALEDLQAMTLPTAGYGLTPGAAAWAGLDSPTTAADYFAATVNMAGFTGVTTHGNGGIRRLATNGVFQSSSPRSAADFAAVRREDVRLGNVTGDVATGSGFVPIRVTDNLAVWIGELNSSTHPDRRIARGEDLAIPDFKLQTGPDLTAWQALLPLAMAGQWEATFAAAIPLGYEVVEFYDTITSQTWFILRERATPGDLTFRGQGTYVFDPAIDARQRLVLQAPHTIFDSGTLEQMGIAIPLLRPRVAFCAGAHRNNAAALSTCDGTFSGSQSYRVSDVAHHPNNFFHSTHQWLNATLPEMRAIQFHGFCCPGSGSYPLLTDDVVVSTGDNSTPPPGSFVQVVADELEALAFPANDGSPGGDVTTVAVYPADTEELGGTTNLQGRLSNGVLLGSECNTSASMATGRFLHVEQDPDVREEPEHVLLGLLAALEAEEAPMGVGDWFVVD
jgi:hypothetical protein